MRDSSDQNSPALQDALRAAGVLKSSGTQAESSGTALLSDAGDVIRLDPNYLALAGHSASAGPGTSWLETLPAELRPAAVEMLAQLAELPDADRILPLLDGPLRWLRVRLSWVTEAGHRRLLVRLDDLTSADATSLVAQLIRDPLTGLYNRRAFLELTALPPMATTRYVGVLAVDVRRFRRINDVWGRPVGDVCLIEVARWLQSISRPGDLLIRLSDAQFFVLLGQFSTAPVSLADQPQRSVRVGEQSLQLSLQAGLATGDVLRETAERAEVALTEAKRGSWRSVVPWTPDIAGRASRLARNEEAVQQAVSAGQEAVHFQPIVNVVTGRVTGLEGLVRLGGAAAEVPTDQILEASHRLGLTPTFAERIYDLAFADGLRLRPVFPDCLLGINVSRAFLSTGLAIDTVLAAARRRGVDPGDITLELTEDVAAGLSTELLLSELGKAAAAGVQVVIDDFGRGETSLSLLRKLPLAAIKIDRSLLPVRAEDERGWDFVEGVASLLAKITGRLIVEGIETPEQSFRLRQLGLYLQQGYLFGAPQPAEHWLTQGFRMPAGPAPERA